MWKTRKIRSPYRWGSSTIVHILTNPSYLGHTCNFKTRKHFKDKKSHYVDQDQWTIIKDTHEPIIDQETYDKEQEALEAEIDSLQKKVDEYEQEQRSADKFIALVKKYQNVEELDAVMLNQFIYKIFVHEQDYKGVANSPQTIEIYFNFVGKFGIQKINSPSEEERAALEEKERLCQK